MDRFEEAKLRIKEATELVALIEGYMPLKQRGRDHMATCPFHAENTASFSVSREKQFFHCFGCGKTGDVFTWLQERDGLTFREAMEVLGERAGIALDGVFANRDDRPRSTGPDPYAVLGEVAAFFRRELEQPGAELARDYLESRGLSAAIDPWCIGYHPVARGALVQFARERKLPRQVIEEAGLLRNGKEVFAGRIIFPIEDERGRTVGFGGRVVPGSRQSEGSGDYKPPKYLNSPESPIFNKRRVLFGLPHSKRAGQRRLLVMEGYTDVIACHLAGFDGAVASLGTAFTTEHARLVERYATDGIVLMFDGDRAGRLAAARAMRELCNNRLKVRMAVMSDAGSGIKDPADLVAARPGDDPELTDEHRVRFADIVDGAEDSMTVWFRLLRDRLDLTEAVNVEAAAAECVGILQLVENPVRQAALRQQMARHLAVPEPTLERMMQKAPRRARPAEEPPHDESADESADESERVPTPQSLKQRAEADLLACVIARPVVLAAGSTITAVPFEFAPVGELVAMAADGLALGRESTAELLHYLFARVAEQPGLRSVLGTAAKRSETIPDAEALLAGIVAHRQRASREPARRELRQQLAQALESGDRSRADALQTRLLETMRKDRPRTFDIDVLVPPNDEPSAAPASPREATSIPASDTPSPSDPVDPD